MNPENHPAIVEARELFVRRFRSVLSDAYWIVQREHYPEVDRIIAAAASKVCEEAVEAEQTRWQKRIDGILRKAVRDVDGSGCDSGDPLDLTATEIELVINELENADPTGDKPPCQQK